jgi:hypothetical protein
MAGEELLVFFFFLVDPSIKGSPKQHESMDFFPPVIARIPGLAGTSDPS